MRRDEKPTLPPLVGRDVELARLATLLETDGPILVVGEAGIGKTSLARAAIAASGRRAFEGGGFATITWMPLLALERATRRTFAGMDAEAAALAIEDEVGDGILFVDDLQWADGLTQAVVARLAGRVGLVIGVRLGDDGTAAALAAMEAAERVDLDALHPSAAAVVVRRAKPGIDTAGLRRAIERAGGNPLLLQELAVAGEDDSSLAAAIRQRLDKLPATAREAMVLLGLARRPLRRDVLGASADDLVGVGLARVEPDGRLAARHDLLGEAAVAAASDDERMALHTRLARAAETPGDAARHHLAAGDRATARRLALEAAAAASGPAERGAHLAVAADAADGEEAVDLRFDAAAALDDGYSESAAVDLLRPALETTTLTPRRARILARVLRNVGDLPGARDAVARGREALESHPGTGADLVADDIGLQLEAAQNAEWKLDRAAEAVRLATAAEELARRHGIDTIRAKFVLGEARSLADDLRGLVDLEEARVAALDVGDVTLAFAAADALVFELLKSGRAEEGYALTQAMQVRANAVGRADAARGMAYWEIQFGWHFGRFPESLAAAEAREALAIPGEGGWSLAQLLIDTGRFAEARIRVDRIVAEATPGEYSLGGALWLLAELEFWSGRHRAASAAADRHAAEVPGAGHRLFIEVVGAWAKFELGEPPTWPAMPALRTMTEGATIELEALRALANGEPSTAAELFEASADAWAGRHARGELRTRWAAGESRRRAGDAKAATAMLLALEERLVAIEARALLSRVHRSLRLLGVRRSAAPDVAPGSTLSGRERQILGLVASGLRDREIAAQLGLSRWTVLRAVESGSAKLGAGTRAEAVAALAG